MIEGVVSGLMGSEKYLISEWKGNKKGVRHDPLPKGNGEGQL